jgi:hypothetical protein
MYLNSTVILTACGLKDPFCFECMLAAKYFFKNQKCLAKYLEQLFSLTGFH